MDWVCESVSPYSKIDEPLYIFRYDLDDAGLNALPRSMPNLKMLELHGLGELSLAAPWVQRSVALKFNLTFKMCIGQRYTISTCIVQTRNIWHKQVTVS